MDQTIWNSVEEFLQKIHKPTIDNQWFYLFGHEEGYEKVKSRNIGYIPFYQNKELEIIESIVPSSNHTIRSNQPKHRTEYIVIHNTGMAHPSATAKGLDFYIHTTTRQASWHYSIDDKEAYLQVPLDEVAWHAGDGRTTYGTTWENASGVHIGGGNQNGIGIESCVYEGVNFNKVLRNMAKLTSWLLVHYRLGMDRIKQHYDFSGKNCPQVIREANRWEEFLELVEIEYIARTKLQEVSFHFESLTKDILSDNGEIINHPGKETHVMYQVCVKANKEERVYSFQSVVCKLKEEE